MVWSWAMVISCSVWDTSAAREVRGWVLRLMGGGGGGSEGRVNGLLTTLPLADLLLGLKGRSLTTPLQMLGGKEEGGEEKSLTISDSLMSLRTLEDLENVGGILD